MDEIFKKIGKTDLFIGVAVIVIGVALVLVLFAGKRLGGQVVVTVDGRTVSTYSLFEDTDTVIEGYNGGKNRLIIKDGSAYISEASCPDKLCMHQGRIKHITESIVCLPNRVTVKIAKKAAGTDENGMDAVAK